MKIYNVNYNYNTRMENLKEILDISKFIGLSEESIAKRFAEIADILFNNYCIVKSGITYEFQEIEFYLYCEGHYDIITYPRSADSGDWYFHSSGLDLCFNSSPKPNHNSYSDKDNNPLLYGGILIRSLKKIINGKDEYITGPLKCCYELFDKFSAIEKQVKQYPYIEKRENRNHIVPVSSARYLNFKDKSKKFKELNGRSKMANIDYGDFEKFMAKPYRFTVDFDPEALEDKFLKSYLGKCERVIKGAKSL